MNTWPNIDVCPSLNLKAYLPTISSTLQWLADLVSLLVIHMICPAVMKNT